MLPPWIDGRYPLDAIAANPLFATSVIGRALTAEPLGFVDIGARGGVHDLVAPIARNAAILGFEPDTDACAELNAHLAKDKTWARALCLPVALADKAGPATLHLCAAPTNHSLLPINDEFVTRYRMEKFAQTGEFPLTTQTLDSVLFDDPSMSRDKHWGEFIKIDTQGTEFEILQGARKTLHERTVALFVEVEFCEIYKKQKLFSDLELLLRDQGFSFFGFHSTHERSRKFLDKRKYIGRERMLHADAVFFRDPLEARSRQTGSSPRQHYIAFTCALLCGYFDFALELVEALLGGGASDSDRQQLIQLVEALATFGAPAAEKDALALADEVKANPGDANVSVGRFVDRRRAICNFEDVLRG